MEQILIVEDDETTASALVKLFQIAGHKAKWAPDGKAALQFVQAMPTLVLLDIKLPDIDGLEVLRRIRSEHRFDGIMIVMWSAIGDQESLDRALKMGAQDYIVKGELDWMTIESRFLPYLRRA